MEVCNCSVFCCTLLYVHSSIAIILMGKRELIALLNLSSWCLVVNERLFLAVPRGCLQFVIVVFPDHTHLLFFMQEVVVAGGGYCQMLSAVSYNTVSFEVWVCYESLRFLCICYMYWILYAPASCRQWSKETLVCMSLVCFYPSFLEICLVNCPSSPKKYRQCHQAVDPGDMYYGRCRCSKFVHPGITNIGLSCHVW